MEEENKPVGDVKPNSLDEEVSEGGSEGSEKAEVLLSRCQRCAGSGTHPEYVRDAEGRKKFCVTVCVACNGEGSVHIKGVPEGSDGTVSRPMWLIEPNQSAKTGSRHQRNFIRSTAGQKKLKALLKVQKKKEVERET